MAAAAAARARDDMPKALSLAPTRTRNLRPVPPLQGLRPDEGGGRIQAGHQPGKRGRAVRRRVICRECIADILMHGAPATPLAAGLTRYGTAERAK